MESFEHVSHSGSKLVKTVILKGNDKDFDGFALGVEVLETSDRA